MPSEVARNWSVRTCQDDSASETNPILHTNTPNFHYTVGEFLSNHLAINQSGFLEREIHVLL